MPSPTIATTLPCACSLLSLSTFSAGRTSARTRSDGGRERERRPSRAALVREGHRDRHHHHAERPRDDHPSQPGPLFATRLGLVPIDVDLDVVATHPDGVTQRLV
jgi:hypothetical protein